MQRKKPPFRADHVGSLLRPPALKAAREKRAKGEISAAALAAIEDREIDNVIRKQEEVGLSAVTDGEFRRSWWHLDFLWGLDGVERYIMDQGIAFAGVQTRAEGARVLRRNFYRGLTIPELAEDLAAWTRIWALARAHMSAEDAGRALQLWVSPAACDDADAAVRIIARDPFVAPSSRSGPR